MAEQPHACSLGVKKGSKGHLSYWRAYKLHLHVADGEIPSSRFANFEGLQELWAEEQ